MKTQDDARFHFSFFVGRFVFGIRFANQRQDCAVYASARLDHVRDKLLLGFFIKILQRFSAGFLVLRQIVVRAIGNAFQFLPAERKFVFDVKGAFGIESALVLGDIEDV